jgi:hypothetical protein
MSRLHELAVFEKSWNSIVLQECQGNLANT